MAFTTSADVERDIKAGYASLGAKDFESAEEAFRRATIGDPDSAWAWRGLGEAAYRTGKFELAERAFRRVLSLNPKSDVRQFLASTLRLLKKYDEAITLFEQLAAKRPNDAALLNNWGNALSAADRMEEAVDVLGRAVEIDPTQNLYRVNLSSNLVKLKRYEEALETLEVAAPESSNDTGLIAAYGNALIAVGRHKDAIRAYKRAQAAGFQEPGMLHNLATALQYVGAMTDAENAYRAALKSDPDFVLSRRQLAGIQRFDGSSDDIEDLGAILKQPALSAAERSEAHFGLAKAYDDLGDYDQAFSHLQAGNQLVRTTLGYDAVNNSAVLDGMINVFSKEFLEQRADWGVKTERPIFILGMPRSGTTLTEQILCSHPKVFGAGELMKIYEIIHDLKKATKPEWDLGGIATLLGKENTRAAADEYLQYIDKLDRSSPFVSDKMPFNFRYVGYISLFFPKARIIHCVRDPLDIGLSCYFARFSEQLGFSFNLVEIGKYLYDYNRVMRHWMKVVSNPILTVSYETLVADQEKETRRMLEFCGLEWDDRCLDFHRTERSVLTASNWQVRQPLYASSVGRWRNYQKHLGPLMASLGECDSPVWSPAGQSEGRQRD